MRTFLKILTFLLPWNLRRRALIRWFGFEIDPTAKIGLSWIFPGKLIMKEGASIDHFNIALNLDLIQLGENVSLGRSNWITGFSTKNPSVHFQHQIQRKAQLIVGNNSAITKKHHLDCTNTIQIGTFATIAGYSSQLLTHSIDVFKNRQDSHPIIIGDYTFIGTNVVILGGARLPAYSVLGAKSLLNKEFKEEWQLYGGVPAKPIQEIPREAAYFSRLIGLVY